MRKWMIILVFVQIFLLCSCSQTQNSLSNKTTNITNTSKLEATTKLQLPKNYTIEKIKNAFLEYINYRLYLYPAKIMDGTSDKDFDNYIGKSIDVEIRLYNNRYEDFVYAHTNMGNWLAMFKNLNDIVYCAGQANEGEYGRPENENKYMVVDKYTIKIPEAHKPNYGTSQHKNKMIDAFESQIKAACLDFYKGANKYYDEWSNVDVYIVDFYEYENGAHAWLRRQDGSITDYPVSFEEDIKGEFKVQPSKGYTMKNISQFNEFGRYQFDIDIKDAVRHFKCNVK